MAGIYIHIPFCQKACHYCDFHFSTSAAYQDRMIAAIRREAQLKTDYLGDEVVKTIYFGGGTPSVLSGGEIRSILETLESTFNLVAEEITLEANPEDLTPAYIDGLKKAGITRLSIGIQSFFDEHLKWMNRSHTGMQAVKAVKEAKQGGFDNLTVDLIYGFNLLTDEQWKQNLEQVKELEVDHFSAYGLTVEPRTVFGHRQAKNLEFPSSDEKTEKHFRMLQEYALETGFRHYEISNLCRNDKLSRHNTSYWKGERYLGLGPSAHSFDVSSRSWNVSNNTHYMKAIEAGSPMIEREILTGAMKLNELIMTRLRMDTGLDLTEMEEDIAETVKNDAKSWLQKGLVILDNNHLVITQEGRLFADRIASDLFVV